MAYYDKSLVELAIEDICGGCRHFVSVPSPLNCKIQKQNYRDFIETKCKFYDVHENKKDISK